MRNEEKFLKLVSEKDTETLKDVAYRVKNREMLRESQRIALKVLAKLDELGWTQKRLAEEMQVRPQQITKIVSGKENLTIETQVKLQRILNIPILAGFLEEDAATPRNQIGNDLFSADMQFKVGMFAEERQSYEGKNSVQVWQENMASLGDQIKKEMKRQGLSAKELSLKAGISKAEVIGLEKNAADASLKLIALVLGTLNASFSLQVDFPEKE
jgi:transcriptional regulator with XRE-family HTH domain